MVENPCESSMKNSIGKPCEGKLHARFDVGGSDSLLNMLNFSNFAGCQALLYASIVIDLHFLKNHFELK